MRAICTSVPCLLKHVLACTLLPVICICTPVIAKLSRQACTFTCHITHNTFMQVNLVKQLQKLVKVRYVEDITDSTRIGECVHVL